MPLLLNWKTISLLVLVQLGWIFVLNFVYLFTALGLTFTFFRAENPSQQLSWPDIITVLNWLIWSLYALPVLLFSWWGYTKSNGSKKQTLMHALLGSVVLGVELFWIILISKWYSSS